MTLPPVRIKLECFESFTKSKKSGGQLFFLVFKRFPQKSAKGFVFGVLAFLPLRPTMHSHPSTHRTLPDYKIYRSDAHTHNIHTVGRARGVYILGHFWIYVQKFRYCCHAHLSSELRIGVCCRRKPTTEPFCNSSKFNKGGCSLTKRWGFCSSRTINHTSSGL